MKMLWRSRRPFHAVMLALTLSPIMFFIMDRASVIIEDLSEANRFIQSQKDYIERKRGGGCIMPQLDPFPEGMARLTKDLLVTCEGIDWVNCYKSQCNITIAIQKTVREIVCLYKDIVYVDDRNFYVALPIKVIGNETYTLNKSDHVKIDCTGKDINSPDVRAHWSGFKVGFRPVPTQPIPSDRNDSYNVMILCFDSTSRNGFIRKMQNSYKYLTEQLGAVILNSYNILGDGTTGALYPILTGQSEEDNIYHRKRTTRKKYIDYKNFTFHKLKKYGYRTAYFEDMPWVGPAQNKFNWLLRQPADHYLRVSLFDDIGQGEKWYQGRSTRHCFGAIPQYQLMMNLADEFLQLDGKKFCFTFVGDVEYEKCRVRPSADKILLSFLQTLSARKALEDTLVMITGDHGTRFSSIRETAQGKLEERLPLMAILLPEKLKNRKPAALTALKNNKDVLTTPFDIHATILDVLDLKDKNKTYKIPGSNLLRAMSLLEPIPISRTCGDAGVTPHWCACSAWTNLPKSSPKYKQVASILAEYIDSISMEQRLKCAKRRIISTEWVIHQSATDHLSKVNYLNTKELSHFYVHPNSYALQTFDEFYQAKIIMSPGNSMFEGTILYNAAGDYYVVTQRDISRVNAYGDESKCISASHPHLNKYCYCKHSLGNTNRTFEVK